MANMIEIQGLHGKWYLWTDKIADADLGSELLRAMNLYNVARINGKTVYKREG